MIDETYIKWKTIKYSDDIEVSNFGEIRSKGGFVYKPIMDNHGYLKVGIFIEGKQKQFSIHRLVAEAFVDNPYNKNEINHKNGDKTNNCQWNLEWCTSLENQLHRKFVLGVDITGKNNPMYGKKGIDNPKFKDYVLALNKENKIVGKYATQTEAATKLLNKYSTAHQISRCLRHDKLVKTVYGYYFIYEKEYLRLTSAGLKPCELLEHPELWINYYKGQSAAKPIKQ